MTDYYASISDFQIDPYRINDDVSEGAPAMETSTPTGNGTGQFNWQGLLGGSLQAGLNYAIQRDQIKMGMAAPMGQPTTHQQVQVQAKQTNFLFLLGCGVVAYLVLSNGAAK